MNSKPLQFNGTAGGYFVVFLVNLVMTYIPFFGWAFSFNFTNKWIAESLVVDGKQMQYNAGYGETLKFISVNILLVLVTFGIYSFWFAPKSYRYAVDHMFEAGTMPEAAPSMPMPSTPETPAAPTAPTAPTAPMAPADLTAPDAPVATPTSGTITPSGPTPPVTPVQ